MKILYIAKGDLPDYQSDMLFHGLRSLYGADCVDANRIWYMYKSDKEEFWNKRVPNGGKSYGHGFTIHGKLAELTVYRNDLSEKINNHFFDFVIYGSITRCADYLEQVKLAYVPEEIAFIDGEDSQKLDIGLSNHGVVFKRELVKSNLKNVHPIEFAVPASQIVNKVPTKIKDWAHIIPGDLSTYIFDDEPSYYKDYQDSMFAITFKKGGYDAQRHYEILANGCVPYFTGIETCPAFTMQTFPKKLIQESNRAIESGKIDINWYNDFSADLLEYTKRYLTTEAMARRTLYHLL